MARKIVNRKELRAAAEAAEAVGASEGKETKKAKKKTPTKRKSRSKEAVEERVKLVWGVFSSTMKRVATFDYAQKKQALQKAEELSAGGKSPHFVQKVKEPITPQ